MNNSDIERMLARVYKNLSLSQLGVSKHEFLNSPATYLRRIGTGILCLHAKASVKS